MISSRKPEVARSIVAVLHLELDLQLSAKQLFQMHQQQTFTSAGVIRDLSLAKSSRY